MSDERASYRQILRSSTLIGGAAFGSIIITSVRTKAFALLIGPAGIGVLGLLTSVLATATLLSQMGTATSGVRQLTASIDDPAKEARLRFSFWSLTIVLALAGGTLIWLFRHPVAQWGVRETNADPAQVESAVVWLAASLVISAVAAGQTTVMQAHRRIGDLARVQLAGGLLGAILGVAAVAWLGVPGLPLAVLAVPLGVLVVASFYYRRVPSVGTARVPPAVMLRDWRALVALGFALMFAQLLGSAAQIFIRSVIVTEMGADVAGLYQAAYAISVTNMGLILTAMIADYFPRLSATGDDAAAQSRLVNQQLRIGLLISGPLLAGLIATAPIVLHILYSSQFTGAQDLLRWHLLGDVFKLGGWALGYVLIVRNDKLLFILVDASFTLIHIPAFLLMREALGLQSAGVAYAVAYLGYFLLVARVCSRRHGVTIERTNLHNVCLLAGVNVALIAAVWAWPAAGSVLGIAAAVMLALFAVRQLSDLASTQPVGGALTSLLGRLRKRKE